jgi:hypothetical protein
MEIARLIKFESTLTAEPADRGTESSLVRRGYSLGEPSDAQLTSPALPVRATSARPGSASLDKKLRGLPLRRVTMTEVSPQLAHRSTRRQDIRDLQCAVVLHGRKNDNLIQVGIRL